MVKKYGVIMIFMKDIISKEPNMGKEILNIQMDENTLDSLKMMK